MYCVQCEQTRRTTTGQGCHQVKGVCGKTEEVADLQDILIFHLQGVAYWAHLARSQKIIDHKVDTWLPKAFFSTLTNVNFDPECIFADIQLAQYYKKSLKKLVKTYFLAHPSSQFSHPPIPALIKSFASIDDAMRQARAASLNQTYRNADEQGLYLLCLYGLKGAAAYLTHAHELGQKSHLISTLLYEYLANLLNHLTEDELLLLSMKIGDLNYQVMKLLDLGATSQLGHPEITHVNTSPRAGRCILVSGHNLIALYRLLEQTEGTGIQVYTHGEMLPAHAYPKFYQFSHLAGHYGGAWYQQQQEFAAFPGAILMTSNCLIDPFVGHYADRLFTTDYVAWPNVQRIDNDEFDAVIACANALEGYQDTVAEDYLTIGFGHQTLLSQVSELKASILSGQIKHIFLVGGCDGAHRRRRYFSEFAEKVPEDCLILTLGCGKFRFNYTEKSQVAGLPKIIDIGQCNDAYSAIQLARALASAFSCHINELPMTLVLSWFEQKAIAVLLTLLSIGIKGIYLGPTLPAFLTDNNITALQNLFDIHLTDDPEQDLANCLIK